MAANSINPVPPANGESDTLQHKPWRCGEPYVVPMPKSGEGKPLHQMYKRMKDYDQETCQAWRDEIDKLLIFAGLFSGTVTAFILDSYKWLRGDKSLDSPFTADPRSVRINIMWFLSLIMCLSTVIFSILCLKWLRDYTRRSRSSSPAEAITIRQMRYDGLWCWKVPDVVAFLPVVLQASVLLFFAGILDLLWSLHEVVAAVITAAVGLVALGLFFTTIAPVVQTIRRFHHFSNPQRHPNTYDLPFCPYRSPVSWVLLQFLVFINPVHVQQRCIPSWDKLEISFHEKSQQKIHGQRTYNTKGLARAIQWLMDHISPELNQDIPRDVYHSLNTSIDRSASGLVLSEWADMTKDIGSTKASSAEAHRRGMHQARYDLLLERLLRKCSPIKENRGPLLELQVRCLNTFEDKEAMVEMYSEAAINCHSYCKEAQDPFCLEENGLLFQAVMTLLKSHKRLRREPFTENHVGSILALLIRNRLVNKDNANLCYQILHQFKLLLDEIHKSDGDSVSTSGNGMDPHSIVLLLHMLDLLSVQKWEADVQRFTGKEDGVVSSLTSLMGDLVFTLEKRGLEGDAADAAEIKSQLVTFHHTHQSYNFAYAC